MKVRAGGFTLVELLLSFAVLSLIALAFFDLFISLTHSAIVAQREAVAETIATNQMEYLKSLPYNNLAVAGGPIVSSSYVPASVTKTTDGHTYTITNNISYADDAYDGCGSYPSAALKQQYCRNYSSSSPTNTDTNPADYKDINVTVTDSTGLQLAELDTDVSALVAETASNTGAMFVHVIDDSGNPVVGATVTATDSTVSPNVNVSDTTDDNGIVIFYDLTPDSGTDYVISASKTDYSSLSTIYASGSLQPTYPNQSLIAQNSSYVTLTIKPTGIPSLLLETTDTSGNPLASAKIYIKGGYKKYTATSDTTYYYDNKTPTDVRPTTDSSGLAGVSNLVPGPYIFCGDAGATNCTVGSTTYYLAAAVPYGGTNPFNPITVPTYTSSYTGATYAYGGNNYLQKVRLMLTTSSSFPRITSMTPYDVSLSGGTANNFSFVINGANLPCSSTASSCSTTVKFTQTTHTYTASCTGASSPATQLTCTVNLTGATAGTLQMTITSGGNTLTLPTSPLLGGLIVTS
jgi:type II secretory pathway pseudopilin PulG